MKDLYKNNKDFREYVDRYMRGKDVKLEDVLEEKLVKEVGRMYIENSN